MQFLRTGHYKIREEAAELDARKQVKTKLGYVPRPRHEHEHDLAKGSGEHLVTSEQISPGTPRSLQVLTSGDWTEAASADQETPKRQARDPQAGSATQSSATTSSSAEVVLYGQDRAEAPVAPPTDDSHLVPRESPASPDEEDRCAGRDLM